MGRKLTVGDRVGEDKIHFLNGPFTLGVAGRLPVVVAAIIIAGKRIKTGRHEGSGSAPWHQRFTVFVKHIYSRHIRYPPFTVSLSC